MSECMEWTGAKWSNGYPEAKVNGRKIKVHRYIWEWVNGTKLKPWPQEVVMHSCDNRLCINPDHLMLGSQAENLDDMWNKGRGFTPFRGKYEHACKHGHPWTEESTYIDPNGDRNCRTCRLDRQRKSRAERRAA